MQTRKVTGKVVMTEALGKSPSGKANRLPCTNFKKKSCQRKLHAIIGMFPNVQNAKRQVDADSETHVHTNTQQNLLMKDK